MLAHHILSLNHFLLVPALVDGNQVYENTQGDPWVEPVRLPVRSTNQKGASIKTVKLPHGKVAVTPAIRLVKMA
jgi:hypothetical protein